MDRKIQDHFRGADPLLYDVFISLGPDVSGIGPDISTDYFSDLCEAIVNQQLSEKAGRTIYNRFLALMPGGRPDPDAVNAIPDDALRNVGMSWSKVRFIKSLSQSFRTGQVNFSQIADMPDEQVIRELTKLHGIGPWSAEMFLMFSLGRPDVFSYGDVGLRRAIKQIYGFKKDPTDSQLRSIVCKWSPYKTYACRILWRSLDDVNIVQ